MSSTSLGVSRQCYTMPRRSPRWNKSQIEKAPRFSNRETDNNEEIKVTPLSIYRSIKQAALLFIFLGYKLNVLGSSDILCQSVFCHTRLATTESIQLLGSPTSQTFQLKATTKVDFCPNSISALTACSDSQHTNKNVLC